MDVGLSGDLDVLVGDGSGGAGGVNVVVGGVGAGPVGVRGGGVVGGVELLLGGGHLGGVTHVLAGADGNNSENNLMIERKQLVKRIQWPTRPRLVLDSFSFVFGADGHQGVNSKNNLMIERKF